MKVTKPSVSSNCKRNVEFIFVHLDSPISPYIRRIFDVTPSINLVNIVEIVKIIQFNFYYSILLIQFNSFIQFYFLVISDFSQLVQDLLLPSKLFCLSKKLEFSRNVAFHYRRLNL